MESKRQNGMFCQDERDVSERWRELEARVRMRENNMMNVQESY